MMGRPGLLVALFVSLAVNLLIVGVGIGVLAGGHLRDQRPPPPVRAGGPLPLFAAGEGLSPENRQAFRRMLREETQGARAGLQDARRARREAWRTLAAEPFDKAAAETALAQARQAEMAARIRLEARVVAFAETLPPAERAALARRLELTGPQPGGRRRPLGPQP